MNISENFHKKEMIDPLEKLICLTFDIDWATDPVLEYTLGILEEYQVKATFFVTHETELLKEFRLKGMELGIHPSFLPFLNGTSKRDIPALIGDLKEIVPDAISARSHCLIPGSPITKGFSDNGIQYELNTLIYPRAGGVYLPWKRNDVWQIPFLFEDDVYISDPAEDRYFMFDNDFTMIKVLNFHPIHVFLNTKRIEDYQRAKPCYKDYEKLKAYRREAGIGGTEELLREYVLRAKEEGYSFVTVKELGGQICKSHFLI